MGKGIIEPKELVDLGLYRSEDEVIEDGIRHIMRGHPEYRIEIAVEKYKREEISLGKAANIAGLALEEMREVLQARGVSLRGPESLEEIREDVEQARKARQ